MSRARLTETLFKDSRSLNRMNHHSLNTLTLLALAGLAAALLYQIAFHLSRRVAISAAEWQLAEWQWPVAHV